MLLLYDCDTNKQETDSEGPWVRVIPENTENTKVKPSTVLKTFFPRNYLMIAFILEIRKDDGGYLIA